MLDAKYFHLVAWADRDVERGEPLTPLTLSTIFWHHACRSVCGTVVGFFIIGVTKFSTAAEARRGGRRLLAIAFALATSVAIS
jgi:hypothetical protein